MTNKSVTNRGRSVFQNRVMKRTGNYRVLAAMPPEPKHMGAEAGALYMDLCAILLDRRHLTEGDLYQVETLANAITENREIMRRMAIEGMTVVNSAASTVVHPLFNIRKSNDQQINIVSGNLGLTIHARTSLQKKTGTIHDDDTILPETGAF